MLPPRTRLGRRRAARRFGLPFWQFALTATDANRFAIRLAREVTGRRRSSSTTGVTTARSTRPRDLDTRRVIAPEGNLGPPVDPAPDDQVVEFNDVEGLERALATGDVACALVEPALTNIGIVLPEPGYHDAFRKLTRENGTLLIIDETHTIGAGPGGYTEAHGLEPDIGDDRQDDRRRHASARTASPRRSPTGARASSGPEDAT